MPKKRFTADQIIANDREGAGDMYRAKEILVAMVVALLLSAGEAVAFGDTSAPFPSPPPAGAGHKIREAYCGSIRAVWVEEVMRLYRQGKEDSLRTVAEVWQTRCNDVAGDIDGTPLLLLLAVADGDLDQHVKYWTIPRLRSWRDREHQEVLPQATYRSLITDMATGLLAREDLAPAEEFVARYFAGQDVKLSDLRDERYRGSALRKETLRVEKESTTSQSIGIINVAGSSDFLTGSTLEFVRVTANKRGIIVHESTEFRLISVLAEPDHKTADGRYPVNFATTGAVMGAAWLLTRLTTDLFVGPDLPAAVSPLRYLWYAPNSRVNFRLGDRLWLSASTNTDCVLARGPTGERGILFSPRLGVTLGGGLPPAEWSALSISVGPQYWWGFEEGSDWHGLVAAIHLESLGN